MDIDKLKNEFNDIQQKLTDPAVFSTPEYPKLAKRQNELETVIDLHTSLETMQNQKKEAEELSGSNDEMGELARAEVEELSEKITETESKLQELLTPKDPNDERNAIFEIRAAAGGDESSLFASELYRM